MHYFVPFERDGENLFEVRFNYASNTGHYTGVMDCNTSAEAAAWVSYLNGGEHPDGPREHIATAEPVYPEKVVHDVELALSHFPGTPVNTPSKHLASPLIIFDDRDQIVKATNGLQRLVWKQTIAEWVYDVWGEDVDFTERKGIAARLEDVRGNVDTFYNNKSTTQKERLQMISYAIKTGIIKVEKR